jgi:hypothetical protein
MTGAKFRLKPSGGAGAGFNQTIKLPPAPGPAPAAAPCPDCPPCDLVCRQFYITGFINFVDYPSNDPGDISGICWETGGCEDEVSLYPPWIILGCSGQGSLDDQGIFLEIDYVPYNAYGSPCDTYQPVTLTLQKAKAWKLTNIENCDGVGCGQDSIPGTEIANCTPLSAGDGQDPDTDWVEVDGAADAKYDSVCFFSSGDNVYEMGLILTNGDLKAIFSTLTSLDFTAYYLYFTDPDGTSYEWAFYKHECY